MKEIYFTDLNDEQVQIIKLIGLENFIKLCDFFGGESLYFPKPKSKELVERNKKIKEEFDGKNYKNLSIKYNICERHIRRIVNS